MVDLAAVEDVERAILGGEQRCLEPGLRVPAAAAPAPPSGAAAPAR